MNISYQNTDDIVAHSIQASLKIVALIEQSFLDNAKACDASDGQYVRYRSIPHDTLRVEFVDLDWSTVYPKMEPLPDNLLELVFPEVCRYFMKEGMASLSKHQLLDRELNKKTPLDFAKKLPICWGNKSFSLKDFHAKIDQALLSMEHPAKKATHSFEATHQARGFLNRLRQQTGQQIPGYFKHHVLKTQDEGFSLIVKDFVQEIAGASRQMEKTLQNVLPSELGGGLLHEQESKSSGFKLK